MRHLPLALVALMCVSAPLAAQTARVAVAEENLRAAPGAQVIASILQGTELRLGERRDEWREATFEAWIWGESVAPEDRDGYDLVVRKSGGENLRAAPNGTVLARARNGMLLKEMERRGKWVRVQRSAWVWEPSLALEDNAPTPTMPTTATTVTAPTTPPTSTTPAGDAGTAHREWSRVGRAGATLLAAPDGDTLADLRVNTTVETLAREGNWTRVRVEGWVWQPSLDQPAAGAGAVVRDVTAAAIAANPEAFRGRLVEWSVQFIALDYAERIRTDFYEGEPYILARGPGAEPGFVYIAVAPDRVGEIERLAPLQRITVIGRIRTPRSSLMNAPVLDLVEVRPGL